MHSARHPEEHLLGQFIPLHYHYNMLLDRTRLTSFREAIALLTPEGGNVLELGGGTGVLSYFAAQRARRVWCVERNVELVEAASRFLAMNGCGERVEVVHDDARNFLPPEPVDVVICEMLHTALAREKQLEVLDGFQRRYLRRFGPPLPKFVPEASLLAVQPVEQSFTFEGFVAPVPVFQAPEGPHSGTRALSDPVVYAAIEYDQPLPRRFEFQTRFPIQRAGELTALRFVTKNIVAFLETAVSAVEWSNQYLVAPLRTAHRLDAGQIVSIRFEYNAGCSLHEVLESIEVAPEADERHEPNRRAA